MTRELVFAANWKMHIAPDDARKFLDRFFELHQPRIGTEVVFFPTALAVETVAQRIASRSGYSVGVQDVYWEPKGAFTGQISAPLARAAGASWALVGHSERRHLFGESDADTNRKVRAVLESQMTAMLCVGEKLLERERDETEAVVTRQLRAGLADVGPDAPIAIAYEPVWAIGTGRNATPSDAAAVHAAIRVVLEQLGFPRDTRVLYGGSVNRQNAAALLNESEIDGVLVGGASLDPESWAEVCRAR